MYSVFTNLVAYRTFSVAIKSNTIQNTIKLLNFYVIYVIYVLKVCSTSVRLSLCASLFFLFLYFDGLFESPLPTHVLRTFCISFLLLVLLGSSWSFLLVKSEVSKLFFFLRKSTIAFFSINCFSKVDTLFLKCSTTNWESPTWEWEWFSGYIC